nr:MAG TPA: hypothetical protein [Caudoviricetes sp.]
MNKEEMLACFDKFNSIKEALKSVDENIYTAITFTVSSFDSGFRYHVCAIRNNKYVKFAFEDFPDTYLANEKTINDYREVLEMLGVKTTK